MSLQRKHKLATRRRALRIRARLDKSMPRVTVFRSLKHIYAQLIDDQAHNTIASSSTLQLTNVPKGRKDAAFAIGKELARLAKEKGVTAAVFDRGSALYHGRVKAVAEGLREGGLSI